jgi:hypothetical protein
MTVAPMPTAVPVMVPVVSPAYLLGLQLLNLRLCRDGGMNILIRWRQPFISAKRTRRQRRGLCARGQRGGPGGNSNGKFQKVAAFHDVSLLEFGE